MNTDQPRKLLKLFTTYQLVEMGRYEISDQLSTQVNIDNLLDKDYYGQIGFYNQLAFGEPRTYSVRFNYAF